MGSKDVRQLLAAARRRGYTVRLDGHGHWTVTGSDGRRATVPGSPRGGKGLHRTRRALRRIGAAP
jgi:hypothetical protein